MRQRRSERPILAVSSGGGHWVQLMRLKAAFGDAQVVYASVRPSSRDDVPQSLYYTIPDATRWSKIALLRAAIVILRIVLSVRPRAVVTTGAAPGLMAVVFGRLVGARTVWVDSIANVERLSLSGRVASYVAHYCLAQWPEVAERSRAEYRGAVI